MNEYITAVEKLTNVSEHILDDSPLRFVKDYKYKLASDDLIPFGAKQSEKLGEVDFIRYQKLLKGKKGVPFLRASGIGRIIDSAGNWTRGMYIKNYHE